MTKTSILFILIAVLALSVNTVLAQQTLFSEEALTRGIDCTTDHMFWGSGVSFYDWDKDGWPDISYCKTGTPPAFYHNNQGTFSEVQFNIPNTDEAKHLLWVDYDNDGDADIFLTRAFGPWSLYRNNGSFNFSDVTSFVGITQLPSGFLANARGAAWSDINKDGFLDLYISVYHGLDELSTNLMFLSDAGTSFTEISVAAGIDDGYNPSFQPAFFDANMDGWPDLYVINDRNSFGNGFYRNNGNLTFNDESTISGLEIYVDAMSNSPGDYDNDGDLDMYVSNNDFEGNFLFNNDGDANFLAIPQDTSHTVWKFSWGAQWIDQNMDGYLDLFVSTSGLTDLDTVHSNHFAINNTDGSFDYRADSGMEGFVSRTYCAATGDFDNDGAEDLALTCKSPFRNEVWRNNVAGHTYIKLSLEGVVSNKDAVGATAYCYSAGLKQMKHTTCGEAYLSQNSQYLTFGLNGTAVVDSVIVHWPSGIIDKLYDQEVNETIHVVEGFSQVPVGTSSRSSKDKPFIIQNRRLYVLDLSVSKVDLYDTSGRLVLSNSLNPDRTVTLLEFEPGIYLIRLSTKLNETIVSKTYLN